MTIFEMINEYQLELHCGANGRVMGIESANIEAMEDPAARKLIEENYKEIMRVLVAKKNGEPLLHVEK